MTCGDAAREALLAAVRQAVADINLAVDSTKVTRNYVEDLRSAEAELQRDNCRWTIWISLSKKSPGKKSQGPARNGAGRGFLL